MGAIHQSLGNFAEEYPRDTKHVYTLFGYVLSPVWSIIRQFFCHSAMLLAFHGDSQLRRLRKKATDLVPLSSPRRRSRTGCDGSN